MLWRPSGDGRSRASGRRARDRIEVRDAGLIVAVQKIEHCEISGYGSLATTAKQLGHSDAARLLGETLQEEKATDEKLNQLALGRVNELAQSAAE
jgi:ferritin-like metal-binding protein YciE